MSATKDRNKNRRMWRKKSFTDALKEKYSDQNFDTSDMEIDIVIVGKPKCGESDAELAHLQTVGLNNCCVSCAGLPKNGLASLCPNVVDLDLSNNLLDDWSEMLHLMSQLPHLKYINLSRNFLMNNENCLKKWKTPLTNVENLVLNSTGVSWEDTLALTMLMPTLHELHICCNGYDELNEDDIEGLESVECLRLNNNRINDWSHIWKLRCLPNLKTLILSGNPLESISYNVKQFTDAEEHPSNHLYEDCKNLLMEEFMKAVNIDNKQEDTDISEENTSLSIDDADVSMAADDDHDDDELQDCEVTPMEENTENDTSRRKEKICQMCGKSVRQNRKPFEKLQSLCINKTDISNWDHLFALSQFPNLQSVRMKDVRLLSEVSPEDRRKMFVACLPNVKSFNGSEVSATERDKSERHFLRHFIDKENKPERYFELEGKHGKLKPVVEVDIGRGFKEWVSLKFIYKGDLLIQDRIHVVQPVGKLRTFISVNLGLHRKQFKMFHLGCGEGHNTESPNFDELILDSLPMSRYDVMDGDEIHIDDVEFKKK